MSIFHNNYILQHPCENTPGRILSAFQGIINGLYCKLNQRADHRCTVYVVFFHLLTAEYKGNMTIIRRKIMQWAEKSYSIDTVVISCHINIHVTLFS